MGRGSGGLRSVIEYEVVLGSRALMCEVRLNGFRRKCLAQDCASPPHLYLWPVSVSVSVTVYRRLLLGSSIASQLLEEKG